VTFMEAIEAFIARDKLHPKLTLRRAAWEPGVELCPWDREADLGVCLADVLADDWDVVTAGEDGG